MVEEFRLTSDSQQVGADVFTSYKIVGARYSQLFVNWLQWAKYIINRNMLEEQGISEANIEISPLYEDHSQPRPIEQTITLTVLSSLIKFCPVCGKQILEENELISHLGKINL